MKKNLGITDRVLRVLVVVIIVLLYFLHKINGTVAVIGLIIAGFIFITSLTGFSPLYRIFGWSSNKKKSEQA
jgi:hypothetical protein